MDGSGRDNEEDLFEMIGHFENQEIELDDTIQYMNESGEGIEEEQPTNEGHTNNDGEGNVLQLTKSGEVYIRPLVIIPCINWFVYILTNLSSFSPPDRANLLQG